MNRIFLLLGLLTLGCSGGSPPSPGVQEEDSDDYGPAPSFQLTDQSGAPRTAADFLGKVWVANFIFTSCPDVCPVLTAKMAALQLQFPAVTYVSFSVDPGTDTPPVLLAYAQRFHALPGWYFLTGPVDDVRRVVVDGFKQAMQSMAVNPGEPQAIIHGDRFVVIDRLGRMRGFPESQSPEIAELITRLQ